MALAAWRFLAQSREMTTSNNHVTLIGRVSQPAEARVLPSGDELSTFRLIVDRSGRVLQRSAQKVDTFECVAWSARLRARMARLEPGQRIRVEGRLRRRFTRAGGSPVSFVSVEIGTLAKAE